jgi:hypothetical protein
MYYHNIKVIKGIVHEGSVLEGQPAAAHDNALSHTSFLTNNMLVVPHPPKFLCFLDWR